MSDPLRPRASLRTAVVWEVLKEALDRRVKASRAATALDVLDTGGGTGNFAVPVARLGHRVTVVDPSPNALFALERRAAEAGVADRVRGVQGDVHGLFDVVERGGYDAVLCHGVLEYVDDPAEGVRNAVEALRPAGALSLLAAGRAAPCWPGRSPGTSPRPAHALSDPGGPLGRGRPGAAPLHRGPSSPSWSPAAGPARSVAVHGVRVFADLVPGVLVDTEPGALEALLKLEAAAAELPAFHSVATQLHVLGPAARLTCALVSGVACSSRRPVRRSAAPYDRGKPSSMTDRRSGNALIVRRSSHPGCASDAWRVPGGWIGVEGRVSRGRIPAYPERVVPVAPRDRRVGGLRAALGARAAHARADGASAVRRRSQVRDSA